MVLLLVGLGSFVLGALGAHVWHRRPRRLRIGGREAGIQRYQEWKEAQRWRS